MNGANNKDDVAHLVETILATNFGDANLDGTVNSTDLNEVGIHWQQQACNGWADGDFTGDGAVTSLDLNELGINWQRTGAAQASEAVHADRAPRAPLSRQAVVHPTLDASGAAKSTSLASDDLGRVNDQPSVDRVTDASSSLRRGKLAFESAQRHMYRATTGP